MKAIKTQAYHGIIVFNFAVMRSEAEKLKACGRNVEGNFHQSNSCIGESDGIIASN